jgi:hypothetical protein
LIIGSLLCAHVAVAAPCESAAVRAAVKASWLGEVKISLVCRKIRAKPAVQLVEARDATHAMPAFAAIVDADDAIKWSDIWAPGTHGNSSTYAIADLDGDGVDELLQHETLVGRGGEGSQALIVHAIVDGEVTTAGELQLATTQEFDQNNEPGCTATWAVVGGKKPRVQVTGTRAKAKQDACPLVGTHRYRWTRTDFVPAD